MQRTGQLKKLVIKGYTDARFETKAEPHEFSTLINPQSIRLSYANDYNKTQASGTTITDSSYNKTTPPSLSVQMTFDGTGIVPGSRADDGLPFRVMDQISEFESIVYRYQGDSHQPNHVIVSWGTMNFKGVVESIDYDYKIFASNGDPKRVVASVRFLGTTDEQLRAAEENKRSPDLTHIRQVKEGDTLPLMCSRLYGDSKYYLEVAKVNRITNFRKLTPGQRINFPPIEKLST